MMPYQWIESPYMCVGCCKRMVSEYGQHESDGELVEQHSCLSCGRVYTCAPERRSPELPEVRERQLLITLEQMLEIRRRHLDRPESLRRQPGLRDLVEAWDA